MQTLNFRSFFWKIRLGFKIFIAGVLFLLSSWVLAETYQNIEIREIQEMINLNDFDLELENYPLISESDLIDQLKILNTPGFNTPIPHGGFTTPGVDIPIPESYITAQEMMGLNTIGWTLPGCEKCVSGAYGNGSFTEGGFTPTCEECDFIEQIKKFIKEWGFILQEPVDPFFSDKCLKCLLDDDDYSPEDFFVKVHNRSCREECPFIDQLKLKQDLAEGAFSAEDVITAGFDFSNLPMNLCDQKLKEDPDHICKLQCEQMTIKEIDNIKCQGLLITRIEKLNRLHTILKNPSDYDLFAEISSAIHTKDVWVWHGYNNTIYYYDFNLYMDISGPAFVKWIKENYSKESAQQVLQRIVQSKLLKQKVIDTANERYKGPVTSSEPADNNSTEILLQLLRQAYIDDDISDKLYDYLIKSGYWGITEYSLDKENKALVNWFAEFIEKENLLALSSPDCQLKQPSPVSDLWGDWLDVSKFENYLNNILECPMCKTLNRLLKSLQERNLIVPEYPHSIPEVNLIAPQYPHSIPKVNWDTLDPEKLVAQMTGHNPDLEKLVAQMTGGIPDSEKSVAGMTLGIPDPENPIAGMTWDIPDPENPVAEMTLNTLADLENPVAVLNWGSFSLQSSKKIAEMWGFQYMFDITCKDSSSQ